MTLLRPVPRSLAIHPLEVLNHPAAGYVLDLVRRFQGSFEWRLDQESLRGLLSLASRHFPALRIHDRGDGIHPSHETLIRRLQTAGDLACDRWGLSLTDKGERRCDSAFRAALSAPIWVEALEQVEEDLIIFAETEGIRWPLHDAGNHSRGRTGCGAPAS